MARAVLRRREDGDGWELACPRELEASIYLQAMTLNLWPPYSAYDGPVKLIAADPSAPGAPAPAIANQAMAAVSDATHVDQLRALARVDELTGVLNRRAFFERLDSELHRARRSKAPLTLVLYDLDQFKALNDGHGHPAGDAALRSFARILERNVRASDAVGRVGGDEFVAICDAGDAGSVVARLREAISAPFQVGADTLRIGVSIGVAIAGAPGTAEADEVAQGLLSAADQAMYVDKRGRRASGPIG